MSYETSSWLGRTAAAETNTRHRMRTVAELRRAQTPHQVPVPAVPPFPAHYADSPNLVDIRLELLFDCGHIYEVETLYAHLPESTDTAYHQRSMERLIGRRGRCRRCPIEPRPVPEDHCTYDWETESGTRACRTRARFHTDEWGGPGGADLCTKHRNHLLREGYLTHPGRNLQGPTTAAPAAQ